MQVSEGCLPSCDQHPMTLLAQMATATKQLYKNCFVPTQRVERFDMYAVVTKVSGYMHWQASVPLEATSGKKKISNKHLACNEQVYTY